MIKFSASNKWYELAAENESDIPTISAGTSYQLVPTSLLNHDVMFKKDIKEIRKLEGFSTLLRMLRLDKGLTVEKLASKLDIEVDELVLLERQVGFKASPRTLIALADFYNIPKNVFLQLIGAIKNKNNVIQEEMIRFAAESESFEKLTKEEKEMLNRILKVVSNFKE